MVGQVFISYSSHDQDTAKRIRKSIEQAGFSCWMAPESIPIGSSYAAEIENAIRRCDAFVLVLSGAAMRSQWVEKELDRALNQRKKILPYVTEDRELTSAFQLYLTNVQMFPAYENKNQALNHLIEYLRQILPTAPSEPLPHNRTPLRSAKKRRAVVGAVILAVILSVVLLLAKSCTAVSIQYNRTTTAAPAVTSAAKESATTQTTTQTTKQEETASRSAGDHIVIPSLKDMEPFSLTPYSY